MCANMLRQGDTCCSQPTDPVPNYTVCFPAQQVIPGGAVRANPFYDVANQRSYWTYTIQIDSGSGQLITDLSHWDLQICSELADQQDLDDFLVEFSADGVNYSTVPSWEVRPEGDPSIPGPPPPVVPDVLKINQEQSTGTTIFYRITILDPAFFDLAAEPGTILIKHGAQPAPGFETFSVATCGSNALPTPSVNCNRQQQPALSLTKTCPEFPPGVTHFNVGDTATITLSVTNSGITDATGVTVLDLINIPAGVTISSLTISDEGTANPPTGPYTNTNITVAWSELEIPAGSTETLTVSFSILAAPEGGDAIVNVDAGIGELSGTEVFLCTIPIGEPALAKSCPALPPGCTFIVGDSVTITLTVDNTGGTATTVTVLDVFNVPAGVLISGLTTNPPATNINPPSGPYTNTDTAVTWANVPIAANSSQVFTITFTILAASDTGAIITNVDAGIGELSGGGRFRCTIPVNQLPPQFRRGIPLLGFFR